MARRAPEENETDLPVEVELTPRIPKRVEYSDDDDDDDDDDSNYSNDDDDDDLDHGDHDDDNDDDDDDHDYSSNKQENERSQSKHSTVVATPSDVIEEKPRPQSKSRIKKIRSKIGSVLSKKKPKPDPSSKAALNKLRQKIQELEDEKAVFQSKMEQMEFEKCSEREAVAKERDNLRAEITKLQSRIEDLMTLKERAEADFEEFKERQNVAASIELHQVRGWLWKRGVSGPTGRQWRHRWFISRNDGKLYYYSYFNQLIPRGFIDIQKITEVKDLPSGEQNDENSCFNVVTPSRTYEIKAKNKKDKLRWITALGHLMYWINRQGSCNEGTAIPSTEDLENN